LDYKKIGPFKILAKIGSSAYKLDLPDMMKIYNTLHISLLEPYENNKLPSQRQEPPPPIIIEGEPEYELKEIVNTRLYYGRLQYRAKWTSYSPEHDKVWYPASNFENAVNAKQGFHERYPEKPSQDRHHKGRQRMDHSTSITTNISSRDTTHLSTNKPGLLTYEKPHTIQVPRSGNELDGMYRRCMPNTQVGQGQHLLSTTPATKQVTCCTLRMGANMRNTTTNDGTLGVQRRTAHWAKDDQRGPPKKKGTTWANPPDQVLPRRMLATQGRKNEKSLLPQKTDTWGEQSKRMGKGREGTPLGGGERKTQPDIEAYQRQIQELLEERERNRKTIADLETNVGNQRRMIASSAFMLGRAENEVRTLRRAMEKYEVLKRDVRRAGRKLLDLGN